MFACRIFRMRSLWRLLMYTIFCLQSCDAVADFESCSSREGSLKWQVTCLVELLCGMQPIQSNALTTRPLFSAVAVLAFMFTSGSSLPGSTRPSGRDRTDGCGCQDISKAHPCLSSGFANPSMGEHVGKGRVEQRGIEKRVSYTPNGE